MSVDEQRFDGQRVVIIGASAGIGEAAARAFASRGATVTITGRSKERLDQAAQRIGYPVLAAELNATSRGALDDFFATTEAIDHLVLCASPGAVGAGPIATLEEAAFRQAFEGKVLAHVKSIQAALPQLRRDGSVTMVTAASARAAFAGTAPGRGQRGAGSDGRPAGGGTCPASGERGLAGRHRHALVECHATGPAAGVLRLRGRRAHRWAGSARRTTSPRPSSTWPALASSPAPSWSAPAALTSPPRPSPAKPASAGQVRVGDLARTREADDTPARRIDA